MKAKTENQIFLKCLEITGGKFNFCFPTCTTFLIVIFMEFNRQKKKRSTPISETLEKLLIVIWHVSLHWLTTLYTISTLYYRRITQTPCLCSAA